MKRLLIFLFILCPLLLQGQKIGSPRNRYVAVVSAGGESTLGDYVAWYKCDEASGTVYDESDNSLDGSASGCTQSASGGHSGGAITFGGTGTGLPDNTTGVITTSTTEFDLAATTGSLSVWFTSTLGAWEAGFIAGTRGEDGTPGYGIRIWPSGTGGKGRILTHLGNAGAELTHTSDVDLENSSTTWFHVVITWDVDGDFITYINGEAVDTQDVSISPTDNGETLMFGRSSNTWNPKWHKGKIDEVRVYDRALTSDEVTELYEL